MVKVATVIIVSVIVAIVFAALGIVIGGIIKDKKAENDKNSAQQEAILLYMQPQTAGI